MTTEILSTSPDGRYQVRSEPWDPRMSIWLYPPEIFDLQAKQIIFKVRDIAWSLDNSEWESNSVLRISLCKYPDIPPEASLSIKIDCANKTAKIGNNEEIELRALGEALEKASVPSAA